MPQVRVHTIGAGGGSIARAELGLLKVGPQSAGASPGPAAYGSGGEEPTGTDAAVALGYIDPAYFLGGEMRLDPTAAVRSIERRVAGPLGMTADEAALAILKVQVVNIVSGIRKVSVEVGKDPRDFVLMPFGGAGGLYAGAVAEEAGMRRILIPPHASVLSALGMLMTDIRHDRVRTRLMPLHDDQLPLMRAIFDELRDEVTAEFQPDEVAAGRVGFELSCDMRYEGQAYEINVRLGAGEPGADAGGLRAAFDREHERLYGQCSPDEPVEVVNLRVGAVGRVEKADLPRLAPTAAAPVARASRPMLFEGAGGWRDCPVHDRAALGPGAELHGPCVIEDRGASIPVLPGHALRVDPFGSLVIDTRGPAPRA